MKVKTSEDILFSNELSHLPRFLITHFQSFKSPELSWRSILYGPTKERKRE